MFLPSRPIILPFISSPGSWTTATQFSTTWLAEHLWMAVVSTRVASSSAVLSASSSILLVILPASSRASSSRLESRRFRASSRDSPAICSRSWFCSSISFVTLCCLAARACSRSASPFSRVSMTDSLRSSFSLVLSTNSDLRDRSDSFLSISERLFCCISSSAARSPAMTSRPSRTASFFRVSDSRLASARILSASLIAPFRTRAARNRWRMRPRTNAAAVEPASIAIVTPDMADSVVIARHLYVNGQPASR